MRRTSSSRRSGAVSAGACTSCSAGLRAIDRLRRSPALQGAERGATVVVLVNARALIPFEVKDLNDAVGDLETAVLAATLSPGHHDDVVPGVHHLLDQEVELPDRGSPLGPVLLDALMPLVGAGVGIVLGRDP